jgi:hypothetical protein
MSVKEQFYNQRPAVLFDPRASQRIDPRFTFTRNSSAYVLNKTGLLEEVGSQAPRFGLDSDPGTNSSGLLIEKQATNEYNQSKTLSSWGQGFKIEYVLNQGIAPDGTNTATLLRAKAGATQITNRQGRLGPGVLGNLTPLTTYVQSIFVKLHTYQIFNSFRLTTTSISFNAESSLFAFDQEGNITTLLDQVIPYPNNWYRVYQIIKTNSAASPDLGEAEIGLMEVNQDGVDTLKVLVWGAQLEKISPQGQFRPTSFISTANSPATRAADLLSVDTVSIPTTGSIYIDAQANGAAVNDTLLSVANSSDEKLLLQTQAPASLYNSLALVYAIDDTFEPTLPFPVPEPGDQRNIITWGDNNYHYQKSNYRKTPSLTASIPENLDRIGIGHDVTDPTKGFNGTLGRLYLWANELPPEIARGLVRGNITVPLNADDGNVIPVAAHALIFNTQGAAFNGDKVVRFQLLGSNNSVSIDWNDGIIETYAGSAANTTITHTYETPGLYLVTITGVFENIKLGNFTGSQASDLVNVAQNGPDWSPTNLTDLYNGCTLLKNEALDDFPDTSLITQYVRAFQSCSSLTSFPLIDTAAGTNFGSAWNACSSLTSFPLINTAAGTSFSSAWSNCNSLTSFPLINTAAGTNFQQAWVNCTSLTSFPLINTAAGTNFSFAWSGCSSLTSFPLINTAAGTNFLQAWVNCSSLTSFPLINTAAGINFGSAWVNCSSLTSFPLINTAAGTNFVSAWRDCTSLTSFPLINTAAGTNFQQAWRFCTSLTSFPLINTAAGTNFQQAWESLLQPHKLPADQYCCWY